MLKPIDLKAQVSGVSFSFSPAIEYTLFENNAALKPGYAFGGSFGVGLGQYLEVQASYLFGESYHTDFSNLRTTDPVLRQRLNALRNPRVNMERYGLSTKVNLSSSSVVPYVTAGTGVVRFTRNTLNSSESLFLSAGAGLMFTVASRYTLFVQGAHTGYRYNPASAFLSGRDLIAGQIETNNFSQQLVTNWNFTGGLKIYLGGQTTEPSDRMVLFLDEFNGGLTNLRWVGGPVYSQAFISNEELGFPSALHFIGLQFGADFGPFAGVRGFYWHGVDANGGIRLDDINAYGAEFKASFFQTSVSPYLLAGGGYLHVHSNFRPESLIRAKSQPFATAGAGIEVAFTSNVSFTGDVRALMLTQDGVDNRLSPSRIELSPMFTLGVTYSIGEFEYRARRTSTGRQASTASRRHIDDHQLESQQRLLVMREAALSTEIARSLAQGDTLTASNLQLQLNQVQDSAMRLAMGTQLAQHQNVRTPDNRIISLPVLDEGEIFIRFGPPAQAPVTVQPVSAPVVSHTAPAVATDSMFREMERLIAERIRERDRENERSQNETMQLRTERERDMEIRIAELEARLESAQNIIAVQSVSESETIETELLQTAPAATGELQGVSVHLGLINPLQASFGVRGDYGSLFGDRFELIPEFVIGLGGKTRMYNLNAITLIPLPQIPYVNISPFSPYTGLGVGIKAFSNPPGYASGIQFLWSFHLGASADFGAGSLYIEYANQNFFSFNNILAGYRFRF
ncbi:MAG: hypothetical protein LAT67_14800 [Balneolales bacterium]|nr:hypothetical protein [Balneolales bacterium]